MSATCYALPTLWYHDLDDLAPIENRTYDETPELYKIKRQAGRFNSPFFGAANNRDPAPIPTSSGGSSGSAMTYDEIPELYNLVEKRQIGGRFSSPFFGAANRVPPAPIPTSNRGSSGSSANRAIALANQLAGATSQPVSWSHGYGR